MTEIVEIPDISGYGVDTLGKVYSKKTGVWVPLKIRVRHDGYPSVRLHVNKRDKGFTVHYLVLRTFIGPRPPGQECRHLDGNKSNNTLENLCWGTRKENGEDATRHLRIKYLRLVARADALLSAIELSYDRLEKIIEALQPKA